MAELSGETRSAIWAAVHELPAVDMRVFGRLHEAAFAGPPVDALLTSPPILAELCRRRSMSRRAGSAPDDAAIRALSVTELADLVWRHLFTDRAPLSEPARRILTALGLFGIDVAGGDLRAIREQCRSLPPAPRLARALELANVELVLYPVESMETMAGEDPPSGEDPPPAFRPVLYLSALLGDWRESARRLRIQGYGLKARVDGFTPLELRRHLAAASAAAGPVALALDWPAGALPGDACIGRLVREAVLPFCRERDLAFLLATGETPVEDLAPVWECHPDNRFLLVPGREDGTGEATMAACGARNVLLCGCDGTLSFSHALGAYTARRLESLGGSFHACHSGAYRAEDLVGAWAHMRWSLGEELIRHFTTMSRTGWRFSPEAVRKEVAALLGTNLREFLGNGLERTE